MRNWSAVITASAWSCPTLAGDHDLAARITVCAYEFADPDAPNVNGVNVPSIPRGAAHATGLPSLFDLGGTNALTSSAQRAVSAAMIDYWSSFRPHGQTHCGEGSDLGQHEARIGHRPGTRPCRRAAVLVC